MSKFNEETKVWEGRKVPSKFSNDTYFGEIILENLKKTPERICQISADDNSELSCDELRIKSVRVAQNLTKIGIKSEDVVGFVCCSSRQMTMALFGCFIIGAPVNSLDPSSSKDDISNMFNQTKPRLVICDSDQVTKVREALSELGNDANVYSLSGKLNNEELSFEDLVTPTGDEEDFIAPKFDQPSDEKILAISSSSGTTGLPKGVMLSHASILSWPLVSTLPSRSLALQALSGSSSFFSNLLIPLKLSDTRIISRKDFSIENLTKIFSKYKPTFFHTTPMILSLILNSDFPEKGDHGSLTTISCCGSIVSESLRKKFSEVFPQKVLSIVYLMTEAGAIFTAPGEYKEKTTVGSLIAPNSMVKIIDDDGKTLGANESGEICFKTKEKFLGYYNNPEATKNAVDDEGFFKSGDIGYFDENGKFYVTDRKTEIVNCLNNKVRLSEIENLIGSVEGVEMVSVVSIPDPNDDILLAAVIVKRDGFALTEQSITNFVTSKLPIHKHLTGGVYFVDEIPLTSFGKIKKRLVREIVINQRQR